MSPITRRRTRWAIVPALALGILAAAGGAANAATTVIAADPAGTTIAPGATGVIRSAISNPDGVSHSAAVSLEWIAPSYSTFTSTFVEIETNTAGAGWGSVGALGSCVLSNGNTKLTCPNAGLTVPAAANGTTSYLRLNTQVAVASNAPYNSTFTNPATWTSNNTAEIGSGSNYPGYKTPASQPATVTDPAPITTIAPGATGTLDSALVNLTGTAHTAGMSIVWHAPPGSTFTGTTVNIETNTAGAGWGNVGALSGCTLSNNNTTLTCPTQNLTIPAAVNAIPSYLRLLTDIKVSASEPVNTQPRKNPITWTSNNPVEIASGSNYPGYKTAASPATQVSAPIVPIAQGATGTLDTAIINTEGTPKTAGIGLVWQAPANSVFTGTTVTVQNTSPTGWVTQKTLTNCVLSNGGKTLTCPTQNITVPASSYQGGSYVGGYTRLLTDIAVDPTAPFDSTFTAPATWTSNNTGAIASGSNNPGYKTPAAAPIPFVKPLLGLGAGALGLGLITAWSLKKKRTATQL